MLNIDGDQISIAIDLDLQEGLGTELLRIQKEKSINYQIALILPML
jgi:hypothetical protein